MKNLLLALLVGLVLLVLGGTAWLWISDSSVPLVPGTNQSEPTTLDAGPARLAGTTGNAELHGEQRQGVPAPVAPDSIQITGHVRRPFDAPQDLELEAFALAEDHEYDEFRETLIGLAEDETSEFILERTLVQADGSFTLTFPRKLKLGHVLVAGKFLYSMETEEVDLSNPEELVITPKIGCVINGQLKATGNEETNDTLGGVRLVLELDPMALEGKPDGRNTLSFDFESEADGQFRLHALPVEYAYTLQIIPEQFAAQTASIAGLQQGEERDLEITLDSGGRVTGRVLDPAEKPVAGARVHAAVVGTTFGFEDEEIGSAVTNAAGEFVLEAMPMGSIGIKADHPNYLSSKRNDVQVVRDETTSGLEIQLTEGRQLTGLVSWPDGTPVKDALIEVSFDKAYLAGPSAFNALRGANGEATSGEDGRFVVNGIGSGPFVVTAEARPLDVEPVPENEIEDESERFKARLESVRPDSDLELVLHGSLDLKGQVLDDQEKALSSFTVHAVRKAAGGFGDVSIEERHESFDNPAGEFTLIDLTEGTWEVTIDSEGFVTQGTRKVNVPTSEKLVFPLVRGVAISGRVLTPAGIPIGNATVTLEGTDSPFQDAVSRIDNRPTVTSDESGAFELTNLPPGSVMLVAEHRDFCASEPQAFDLVAGGRFQEAELRLREGGRLTGLVYAKNGEYAAGYLIVLNSPTMEQMFSNTNSEGEFEVDNIPPGVWQAIAMNSGSDYSTDSDGGNSGLMGAILMSQAEITDGETTHIIIGAPPADPVKITGEVTHGDEPFKGASLIFFQEGSRLYENMKFATFEDDGRYSVTVDGPGNYVVFLQKMGRTQVQQQNVEFNIEVPRVAEYEQDLEVPTGRISGTVTDAAGNPAVDARVTLATDGGFRSDVLMGGQYSEVQTDANGQFDLVGLRPGTYTVAAGGAMLLDLSGQSSTNVGRVTRGGVRLQEGEWKKNLNFALEAPGALEVSVIGLDGNPLIGAGVFLRDSEGRPLEPFNMATTNAAGVCLIKGLAPGDYTVMSRIGLACSQESAPVRITTGKTEKLEIRLEQGTVVWIKLQDSDGEEARASVSIIDRETGRDWAVYFGMDDLKVLYLDGAFSPTEHRIGPLPPGKYKIHAKGEAGSKKKPVTLRGEPERKLTLRLK